MGISSKWSVRHRSISPQVTANGIHFFGIDAELDDLIIRDFQNFSCRGDASSLEFFDCCLSYPLRAWPLHRDQEWPQRWTIFQAAEYLEAPYPQPLNTSPSRKIPPQFFHEQSKTHSPSSRFSDVWWLVFHFKKAFLSRVEASGRRTVSKPKRSSLRRAFCPSKIEFDCSIAV